MSKENYSVADLVEMADGNSEIGRFFGISPQSVSDWKAKGRVPTDRVPGMEKLTGIPRHLIRPDRPDLFPPPQEGTHVAA